MKVLKSTVEKWHIRRPNGWWCGNFLFDNANGEICIHSDWGNWNFSWHSMGSGVDLKSFLVGCNPDYLMSKFANHAERSWFDWEATIKAIKLRIIELRKKWDLDEDIARLYWDELVDLEEVESTGHFWERYFNTTYIKDLYYDHSDVPVITDYHPRLRAFMREGWPLFIKAIHDERLEIQKNGDVTELTNEQLVAR